MIIDEPNNNIFIIEKVIGLKNALNKDKLNLEELKRKMENISEYYNYNMYEYLNALLDPIKNKGGKVPSKIPVPTCSFQLHNSMNFGPGTNGLDLFAINPWFLASDAIHNIKVKLDDGEYYLVDSAGLYFFNANANVLDGTKTVYNMNYSASFVQTIPDVYAQYRLVSACIEIKYIGELERAEGIIGGGISFLKTDKAGVRFAATQSGEGSWGSKNPDYGIYGNFEIIRDCFYNAENSCLEGLRMLYFPLDNSFNEFKQVFSNKNQITRVKTVVTPEGNFNTLNISNDCFRPGFSWIVYLMKAPVNAGNNFKLDYYFNFECIPKAEFLNYMPITLDARPRLTDELRKKFIEEVKEKAITKLYNKII